jgi:hypothetical protein
MYGSASLIRFPSEKNQKRNPRDEIYTGVYLSSVSLPKKSEIETPRQTTLLLPGNSSSRLLRAKEHWRACASGTKDPSRELCCFLGIPCPGSYTQRNTRGQVPPEPKTPPEKYIWECISHPFPSREKSETETPETETTRLNSQMRNLNFGRHYQLSAGFTLMKTELDLMATVTFLSRDVS